MGCRKSLKVYILDARLDKFKENVGAYSEEQGERFHQDILDFERRYQGQYNEYMTGEYIWGLIREMYVVAFMGNTGWFEVPTPLAGALVQRETQRHGDTETRRHRESAVMRACVIAVLLQLLLSDSQAMQCREVAGQLRQIDVSGGQVFGTNADDAIFTLYRDCWTQVPGALKHITVGPSGIWGVNSTNAIFKLVNANWVQVPGQLNQIDAGGVQFVAGVNTSNNIRCLGQRYLGSPVFWQDIPGSLKYCSCGPQGCWGVDNSENIYVLLGVTTQQCQGTGPWQQVNGSLSMLEVGSDGSVYGVNHAGDIYHRDGITSSNPAGTGWTFLRECGKSKHVSFDQGHLWVITQDNQIMDCS
ncbi:fish-egg lectin-like [Amia ocellicauda]|uniref:fish-egg lectin-like n=1 Tax=Amia ocellicauda TaxID=2972642 RepID=UPI003463BAF1